jgi:hypothetical protein
MKEHLNLVNANKANTPFDHQKDLSVLGINTNHTPSSQSSEPGIQLNTDDEDWFNVQVSQTNTYNFDTIADMDFDMAMESAGFIRQMAQKDYGRSLMAQAHKPMNPKKVIQLFNIA